MNKYIIAGALAIIAIIVAVFAFFPRSSTTSNTLSSTATKTYADTVAGFSFSYPDNYILTEQTSTSVHSLVLTRKEDLPLPQNSEAPPTISVSAYPNPSSTPTVDWLTAHGAQSNYTLPNTATSTTLVAGSIPAVGYLWSGLYQGLSIAFEHNNSVIVLTGMYNSPSDQIVKDYESIVASIKVQ